MVDGIEARNQDVEGLLLTRLECGWLIARDSAVEQQPPATRESNTTRRLLPGLGVVDLVFRMVVNVFHPAKSGWIDVLCERRTRADFIVDDGRRDGDFVMSTYFRNRVAAW